MDRNIHKLQKENYDLLVIGGGINGAAIARLAAGGGCKTALIEKGDFAGGTSSKSTKLIHGGLRYLEQFEFGLVREALKERKFHLNCVPHLVKPLEFVIPVYKQDPRPMWMMHLGVWLYDLIAAENKIAPYKKLSPEEVMQAVPILNRKNLLGGFIYYDAQMDDARLCLENILSAAANGAEIANHVQLESFLKTDHKACGIRARDLISGACFDIRAKNIVCALGPWTNQAAKLDNPGVRKIVRTTKGVHIVYKGVLADKAVLATSRKDKRLFFILPWKNETLIGTTDTDYNENPDEVCAAEEDIEELLQMCHDIFPKKPLMRKNILSTFAGLRPLINKAGNPSSVSRRHVFVRSSSNIVFVVGGKYTTYRVIAKDYLEKFLKISDKSRQTLYGSGHIEQKIESIAAACGLSPQTIKRLIGQYGARFRDVLALIDGDDLKEFICHDPPVIAAEIAYAIKTEMARSPDDIVKRRLSLLDDARLPDRLYKISRELLQKYLGDDHL